MHILATTSASLDDRAEPVDLGQAPGDVAVLSFTDSDLAAVAAAWRATAGGVPQAVAPPAASASACDRHLAPLELTLRLASLRDLRHPMSVDLWIDRVAASARVVVVRLLGGLDWWRYGVERLAALAAERSRTGGPPLVLAVLPGDDRDDPRLAEFSTLPPERLAALLAYFREGGADNLRNFARQLREMAADASDRAQLILPAVPIPRATAWLPERGAVSLDDLLATLPAGRPVVPVIFYRSMLLADDLAPVAALVKALAERGLAAAPLAVASLKEPASKAFVTAALGRLAPAAILTATAFAAGEPGEATVLDAPGVPVLQAIVATTRRDAWVDGRRGLAAADMAMHVVLPELDGRVLAGAVSFKDAAPPDPEFGFTGLVNRAEEDRVAAVADRVAALVRLQRTPPAARRLAILLPDYPGPAGRAGYAVGLDVPESTIVLLSDLAAAGWSVAGVPADGTALMRGLARADVAEATTAPPDWHSEKSPPGQSSDPESDWHDANPPPRHLPPAARRPPGSGPRRRHRRLG